MPSTEGSERPVTPVIRLPRKSSAGSPAETKWCRRARTGNSLDFYCDEMVGQGEQTSALGQGLGRLNFWLTSIVGALGFLISSPDRR